MASVLQDVATYEHFVRPDKTKHVQLTLGAAAAVTRVEIPNFACNVIVNASGGNVIVAIDEDPVLTPSAATSIAVTDMGSGVIVDGGLERSFSFEFAGVRGKQIRLTGDTGAEVVKLSFL